MTIFTEGQTKSQNGSAGNGQRPDGLEKEMEPAAMITFPTSGRQGFSCGLSSGVFFITAWLSGFLGVGRRVSIRMRAHLPDWLSGTADCHRQTTCSAWCFKGGYGCLHLCHERASGDPSQRSSMPLRGPAVAHNWGSLHQVHPWLWHTAALQTIMIVLAGVSVALNNFNLVTPAGYMVMGSAWPCPGDHRVMTRGFRKERAMDRGQKPSAA